MEYVNPEIESQIQSNVDALQYKAILNYMKALNELQLGHLIDREILLEIISLIDIYSALDQNRNYYKSFYING